MSIVFTGLAGQDIDAVRLTIDSATTNIFSDVFESGDASAWN